MVVSSCGHGYQPLDAYNRGYRDGSLDRSRGRTHNPHINDPSTLHSAHRKDYVLGYCEGYRATYSAFGSK